MASHAWRNNHTCVPLQPTIGSFVWVERSVQSSHRVPTLKIVPIKSNCFVAFERQNRVHPAVHNTVLGGTEFS